MNDLISSSEISPSEARRGRRLLIAAFSAPAALAAIPAALFLLLTVLAGGTSFLPLTIFAGIVLTILGFVAGLVLSGVFVYKRAGWRSEMREHMAARGIRAEEVGWFRREIKSSEKRALAAVERSDRMLADAYGETLASRLTATRMFNSSKRELQASRRRKQKLEQLKSNSSEAFRREIDNDIANLTKIKNEAGEMLSEAESRLQMIEAAASRGSGIEKNRIVLEKLALRGSELPLALRDALKTREMRETIEKEIFSSSGEEISAVVDREKD